MTSTCPATGRPDDSARRAYTAFLDTTTIDLLDSLLAALRERSVDLYLVRVVYPVRVILRRAGFVAKIGEDHTWHTIVPTYFADSRVNPEESHDAQFEDGTHVEEVRSLTE